MDDSRKVPPFRFDLRSLLQRGRNLFGGRLEGITINLPFVSLNVAPKNMERQVAREIIIRMADRRVLNASECCDDCIANAVISIQEIRSLLVDRQVELANAADGALYLTIELMVEAIRQFLTYKQRLDSNGSGRIVIPSPNRLPFEFGDREKYFSALEMLRAHLHRCLLQIAKIAETTIPKIAQHMRYDEAWQVEAYEPLLDQRSGSE